jgi:hypothetical protein
MGTIKIDANKIVLNKLSSDPANPEEGWLWYVAGTNHIIRFHNGTTVKSVGDVTSAEVDTKISDHAAIPDAHHSRYTDAEAQATVKANVEVGDLKAPTKALNMNGQKISGLGTPTTAGDALPADANLRAPDSSKLEGHTMAEVQDHPPKAHDHTGDTLKPATIEVGDIVFANGWKMTEDYELGVVLISPSGRRFRMVEY